MNRGRIMREIAAERAARAVAKEAKTVEDAVRIVRRAVESNPTLRAMDENAAGEDELLALAGLAVRAAERGLSRRLRSARIAANLAGAAPAMGTQAARMAAMGRGGGAADPHPAQDERHARELAEVIRRQGWI